MISNYTKFKRFFSFTMRKATKVSERDMQIMTNEEVRANVLNVNYGLYRNSVKASVQKTRPAKSLPISFCHFARLLSLRDFKKRNSNKQFCVE